MAWKRERGGWQTAKEHYFALLTSINFIISLYVIIETSFSLPMPGPIYTYILKCHKTVCRSYSSIMNDDYQIMVWLPIENLIKKLFVLFLAVKWGRKSLAWLQWFTRKEVKWWKDILGWILGWILNECSLTPFELCFGTINYDNRLKFLNVNWKFKRNFKETQTIILK